MDKQTIKNLVKELTLQEKASLCSGNDFWHSKAIERLNIPSFSMSDGPNGLRKQEGESDHLGINESVEAVCFPTLSAVACSFDRNLVKTLGAEIGKQAQSEGVDVLLAPGVNIKRSPLCGRNFEYFSEDPFVSGELGASFIDGVQSEGVGACLKHFVCNNQETRRMTSSSEVDERGLHEIYFPAFEKVVKTAKPWSIMSSYNKLNGKYVYESRNLLTDVLRGEWGFDGVVISDWNSINFRAGAVAAGCDLTMPAACDTDVQLVSAVESGKFPEVLLDIACENIITLAFKAAENRRKEERDLQRGHRLAVKVEEESAVLLKNDGLLPLSIKQKIVFIGDFAKNPRFQGGGSSRVNTKNATNAFDCSKKYADIVFTQGYDSDAADEKLITEAVTKAQSCDVAVLFVGLSTNSEVEGGDRSDMKMPDSHLALIDAVCAAQPNTVVVIHNGSPIEMPWVNKPKAILEMYLGGEGVGEATTNLLFGKSNPSGRLAETFPLKVEDNPSYLFFPGTGDISEYRESIFVGYRYYESKKMSVCFPFGFGLSYTQFKYTDLAVDNDTVTADNKIKVTVNVENVGKVKGKEVVQLYVAVNKCEVMRPVKELRAFEKITLEPNEQKTVTFTLDKKDFSYWNNQAHAYHLAQGDFEIQICANAHDVILSAPIKAQEEQLAVKVEYTEMTLLGEIVKTNAGKDFFDNHLEDIYNGIIASGVAKIVLGGAEVSFEQFKGMASGLYGQPVKMLKSFLPNVTQKEWEALFEELNK